MQKNNSKQINSNNSDDSIANVKQILQARFFFASRFSLAKCRRRIIIIISHLINKLNTNTKAYGNFSQCSSNPLFGGDVFICSSLRFILLTFRRTIPFCLSNEREMIIFNNANLIVYFLIKKSLRIVWVFLLLIFMRFIFCFSLSF